MRALVLIAVVSLAGCEHPGQLGNSKHSGPDLESYNANLYAGPAPKVDTTTVWWGDSYVALGAWPVWFPGSANDGVGGNTVGQVLARARVATPVPGTAYVWCGVNDLLQGVTEAQTASDYAALVALLQSQGDRVVCLSPLPPGAQFPADLGTLALTPGTVASLDQAEAAIAVRAGATWIDVRPAVVDGTGWCNGAYAMPCGLHLDAAGYVQVLGRITKNPAG